METRPYKCACRTDVKPRGLPAECRSAPPNATRLDMFFRPLCLVPFAIGAAVAVPAAKRGVPSIRLDDGTFIGTSDGIVDRFLGIPFGKPPWVIFSLDVIAHS